jgi:peptidoglycan/LPS O-acetylase OafA/YrhL
LTSDTNGKLRGYLPSLDGWRAIAVLLVVFYHAKESLIRAYGPAVDWLLPYLGSGWIGVSLFFGISGILITSRLLEEKEVRGQILLKKFYVRRFCRILPPVIFLLIVLAVCNWAKIIPIAGLDWWRALLFASNYGPEPSWHLAHTWSLSIEEHFYLFWPALLVWLGARRAPVVCLVLVILITVWRVLDIHYSIVPSSVGISGWRTDTTVDGLLVGAMFACLLEKRNIQKMVVRLATPLATVMLIVMLVICLYIWDHVLILKHPVRLLFVFLIPSLLLTTILSPSAGIATLLEWRPLRWIGRISYSIYLWQQFFFVPDHATVASRLGGLQDWPWNLLAVLVCAVVSYYCIERPFMAVGHRLAKPATEGRV